jgi:hypothetical protein
MWEEEAVLSIDLISMQKFSRRMEGVGERSIDWMSNKVFGGRKEVLEG